MMMLDVVLHLGHCYRTSGATGTRGHRGTEQEFVSNVGEAMVDNLRALGFTAETALADDPNMPRCKVFMALHQDGGPPSARGASVGYPSGAENAKMAQIWKAHYAKAGWPSHFRPDNYTPALSGYFGFRRINADVKFLIEHGFATNRVDADWMWDNVPRIVGANCNALMQYLVVGNGPIEFPPEEGDMQIINDPNKKRMWAGWVKDGTQHVDEYSVYVEGAGVLMPNVSYVIDDQVKKKNIVKVG